MSRNDEGIEDLVRQLRALDVITTTEEMRRHFVEPMCQMGFCVVANTYFEIGKRICADECVESRRRGFPFFVGAYLVEPECARYKFGLAVACTEQGKWKSARRLFESIGVDVRIPDSVQNWIAQCHEHLMGAEGESSAD